ncbi:hypothetical protein MIND_00537800 [Mycena indigotica]|uniref:Aminoglycoside phosphotransferase domain-containing protein n=1 Tax=Mycena indigotica TaxID=2126181 RepID=A0A8H6WCJ4_9AGAR|nr:uncharacterized protein MIND_00537800 [Mycena indigotica]KAF7307434.1 hypothetical protein MIND_00537800 [Mycena indigotica]
MSTATLSEQPRYSCLPNIPEELQESERKAILEFFHAIPTVERRKTNIFYVTLPDRPAFAVKYAARDAGSDSNSTPRVPRVYHVLYDKPTYYYLLVMEKIPWPTIEACTDLPDEYTVPRVAAAVKWLFDQTPYVPPSLFGRISVPLEGERPLVWHRFFKDHEPSLAFVHAEALSKYVTAILSRYSRRRPFRPVSFADEPNVIYHSDVRKPNFLIDRDTGQICIIDFQHIGIFPQSFRTYGLLHYTDPLAAAVREALGLEITDTIRSMCTAAGCLVMTGGAPTFGLDEYGVQKKKYKRDLFKVNNVSAVDSEKLVSSP